MIPLIKSHLPAAYIMKVYSYLLLRIGNAGQSGFITMDQLPLLQSQTSDDLALTERLLSFLVTAIILPFAAVRCDDNF